MAPLAPAYYAYWSGLPTDAFDTYIRAESGRGWAAIPTHDELTCVVQGWPQDEFASNRKDVEGSYLKSFDVEPEFAERIHAAERESRFVGAGDLSGYFRKPYGLAKRSWATPATTSTRSPRSGSRTPSATRRPWRLRSTMHSPSVGPYEDAMADYQRARDEEAMPIYEFTCDFAKLEPPLPEMQQLIGAMYGNQEAMDDFVSVMAGTLPAPEFFAPENAGRIISQAAS